MASPRVLRIARSDESNAFVLVHVVNTGPAPLDLTLTATEGECPYTASVHQSRLRDLCVKNYQGTDHEWAQVVSLVLGQSVRANEPVLTGIEASAGIAGSGDEDKEIVITIRKRVQAITQRLGALVLRQDDEQAIELYEWSGIAAARANELEQEVISLGDRYRVAEDTISKLNEQLEELMRAKSQHENQLVANFIQLLNEKKLKIRNQQRLLVAATADPAIVSEIQAAAGKLHKAADSHHSTKRRAREMDDTDGDSDEGFEQMDIDWKRIGETTPRGQETDQETDDEGPSTPQPLEEEENTATDDELDQSIEAEQSAGGPEQTGTSRRPTPPKETAPPRRELPFTRRDPPKTESRPEPSEAAEETGGETDDDEL